VPPAYQSIFPPSPPSSPGSSPISCDSIGACHYDNPFLKSILSPSLVKPVLSHSSSTDSLPDFDCRHVNFTDVLAKIFPESPVRALPSQSVDLSDVSPKLSGAVLNDSALGTRTFYVLGQHFEDVDIREMVCNVLEKAEEELACTGVVICLEKKTPDLGQLLHSLMYVGGTIYAGPYRHHPAYVLVGLDL